MALITFRTIIDHEDDIFRDIRIDSTNTLEELHLAVIHAFHFGGDQMTSFYLSDEDWEKGEEFPLMPMDDESKGMDQVTLDSLQLKKGSRLLYVYDFLRMWCFYLEVEKIEDGKQEFPSTIYSFGESPKEDSKEVNLDLDLPVENTEEGESKKATSYEDILNEDDDLMSDSGMFESLDDHDNI